MIFGVILKKMKLVQTLANKSRTEEDMTNHEKTYFQLPVDKDAVELDCPLIRSTHQGRVTHIYASVN